MKGQQMKEKTDCATFTESNFENEVIESSQPVLVAFEADWSGTCDIMMPILENLCVEYEGRVKIGMIDFDENKTLVARFRIFTLPALVFFRNGEIVDHITGLAPRSIITAKLNDIALSAGK